LALLRNTTTETRPDEQLGDVLERFAPPLAPWTRCTACNGLLSPVDKADVQQLLPPGTRRTYQAFSRCVACGHIYWRGAHSRRLEPIVESAIRAASPPRSRATTRWSAAPSSRC
ncbi:MAG: Mut7-C RNAse domain-containing protein, partial [Succinivibrio sp.]